MSGLVPGSEPEVRVTLTGVSRRGRALRAELVLSMRGLAFVGALTGEHSTACLLEKSLADGWAGLFGFFGL